MLLKTSISFLWFTEPAHMPHRILPAVGALCLFITLAGNFSPLHAAPQHNFEEFCLILRQNASEMDNREATATLARKTGASFGWTIVDFSTERRGAMRRLRLVYDDKKRAERLEIDAPLFRDDLHSLRVTKVTANRPQSLVILNADCALQETRRIHYGETGTAAAIAAHRADGSSQIMEVNPPPLSRAGQHMTGATAVIGHIDSGIDYRRPDIINHLRFTPDGTMVAMDAWDGDGLPYDAHFGASPFFPQRHGTYVFDALHQVGVDFILLPVRYPRPDMQRMNAVIHWLARQGANIIMVPLGSRRPDDWTAFTKAAAAYPHILFIISAGNDSANIDRDPVYPAINMLENALTVTSTLADGRIAAGSNFGTGVDIGLPAENLDLAGVDGIVRKQAGSSFAVPKLAAYAACVMNSRNPDPLTGATLAQHIKERLPSARNPAAYGQFLSDTQIKQTCQDPRPRNRHRQTGE